MNADKAGGILAVLAGAAAGAEAVRLYPMRQSDYAGDHLLLGLIGCLCIQLGLILLLRPVRPSPPVSWPAGAERRTLLLTLAVLLCHCLLLPLLGYLFSTFLTAVLLLRIIGRYAVLRALLYALILTFFFHLVFILGLQMPLPTGLFPLW